MIIFVLIFTVVTYASFIAAGCTNFRKANSKPGRIVNGISAKIEQYPYQVALEGFDTLFCGGSLIAEDIVITAAHCLDHGQIVSAKIRAGSSYLNENGTVIQIVKRLAHPKYDRNTVDYDVGLLWLEKKLELSVSIQPISLPGPTEDVSPGTMAVVTGWGLLSTNGAQPKQLQQIRIPIIAQKDCIQSYPRGTITDRMICAGFLGKGGKDACQGDSGGPLAVGRKLYGIVSWAFGCALKFPGVYTRISAVRDWIRQETDL